MTPRVRWPKRRGRTLRRVVFVGGTLLLSGAVVFGLALAGALQARDDLLAGQAALGRARQAVSTGDLVTASAALDRAERFFDLGGTKLDGPRVAPARWVPVVSRSIGATVAVADAARAAADSVGDLLTAFQDLPSGAGALAPTGGRVPLQPLQELAAPLASARDGLNRAREILTAAPATLLLAPVADARAEAALELDSLERTLAGAVEIAATLPAFLGAEGPRTYFVGAQNPAELRGTGGLVGAYAVMTAEDGALQLGDFGTVVGLGIVDVADIEAPDDDYAARYNRSGGAGFWSNINMTPDVPAAAAAMEELFARNTGKEVDGTILADPFAIEALLGVVGPTEVPGVGTVEAGTVVGFLTNEAYTEFASLEGGERQEVLGEVAGVVLRRFLEEGDRAPAAMGAALIEAAAAGHLLFHSKDPEEQAAFEVAGIAGRMPPAEGGDFLGVVANNAAAHKADFYLDRTVEYDVTLQDNGQATGTATVHLTNHAPTTGQPPYVIGPYTERLQAGENLIDLSTYCAASCRLDSFAVQDRAASVESAVEYGRPVYSTRVRLHSGDGRRLAYHWTVEKAWTGDNDRGAYRLRVHSQPTIRPVTLRIGVTLPDGMALRHASVPFGQEGQILTWEGTAADLDEITLIFDRPLPDQLWSAARTWLATPVAR